MVEKSNMKLCKWQNGRQESCEYKKLPLFIFKIGKFGFDCYILKYKENQVLPEHTDPVKNAKHWRLNIGYGTANFVCEKVIFGKKIGKLTVYIFRPDLHKYSLYIFEKTTKVSFGFAKYD